MQTLDFPTLVHNYCQWASLPTPPLSNGCSCVIVTEGAPPVVLAWDEEHDDIVIIVPLSEKAHQLDAQEAYEILCAAFVGQNLNGAAVGIDPATGVLSLWRRLAGEAASLERLARDIKHTTTAAQQIGN